MIVHFMYQLKAKITKYSIYVDVDSRANSEKIQKIKLIYLNKQSNISAKTTKTYRLLHNIILYWHYT